MIYLLIAYGVIGLLIFWLVFHAEILQGKPQRTFVAVFEGVLWPAFVFNLIRNMIDIYQEEH